MTSKNISFFSFFFILTCEYFQTPPPAQSWAERALRTYSEKREAKKQSGASDPDVELLHKIRNNINTYTVHAKTYARKVTGHYSYN